MIVALLGGLGMFLLGMVLMTDGLKAFAGDALRRVLTRVVAGPISGMISGAVTTAMVQSSTATTITTIGFVSAGLLTFTQAVGVIFGANIGTTSTGWIVSQLGFKVSLGSIAPPVIFLGVAMRIMGRGRMVHLGSTLAGFGLLFVGLDMLQHGMGGVAEKMSPGDLPGSGLLNRAIMVGFGILMTVVMQSSSAAMATTLAAVAAGAIGLEQAAGLVIGQNVGTAVTSAVAAVGATTAAKRTALAHILFNVFTGAVAFFVLPLFVHVVADLVDVIDGEEGSLDAPTALAAFHTVFNVLGVAILLPAVKPFARLIERIVPERFEGPTRFLDSAVAETGPVAIEAARRALTEILHNAAAASLAALHRGHPDARVLGSSAEMIGRVRSFVLGLLQAQQSAVEASRLESVLHAIDHVSRLIGSIGQAPAGARSGGPHALAECRSRLEQLLRSCTKELPPDPIAAQADSEFIAATRRVERKRLLEDAAARRLEPDRVLEWVEELLWLDRIAYHTWRASAYLSPTHQQNAEATAASVEPSTRTDT